MTRDSKIRVGLALGSGAARGWSHIGVIRALVEAGIEPEIVCGASAGAVVGAFYAADELDKFERWVRDLDRRQLMALIDPTLRGGLLKARKVFDALALHRRALDGRVQIVGIALVVLAMVNLHRSLVDVRLECVVGVGKIEKGERHKSECLVEWE